MAEETAEALTAQDALAAITRGSAFDGPLRRRVEGVTWMLWGLVVGGVSHSGSASELVFGYPGPSWSFLFIPFWLLAGVAATTAVWRVAALARPSVHPGRGAGLKAVLLAAGLVAGIWLVGPAILPGHALAGLILPTLATPWLALAALNPHRGTAQGRAVLAAIGALQLAAGAAWLSVLPGLAGNTFPVTVLVAGYVGAGVPLAAGLWQVLRG